MPTTIDVLCIEGLDITYKHIYTGISSQFPSDIMLNRGGKERDTEKMSSIGPQLPPHLQKRKRTPEDDDAPESPPSKTMRPANNDEIALDDDSSDDDYGPSTAPAPQTASKHGPALPSPTSKPTRSPTRPSIGPAMPPPPTTESRSTIGPAPPPAPLSTRPSVNSEQASDSDTSDDDDDDYGPSLPTSAAHQSRLSAAALPSSAPSSAAPQPPKRDDWMLAPPSAPTAYRERDPTKLRARKFATGKAAAGNEAHAGGVSAIWTETPEEKARRLRDAVLGRGGAEEPVAPRAAAAAVVAAPRGEKADEDKIRSFTEQTRGRSLYEEHQLRKNKGKAEEGAKEKKKGDGEDEDDDPSKRAFSWEKDMKSSGTISHTQRRQLLAKSADFGGRFDKGRYL